LGAGAERDVESKPVSLQEAACGGDQEYASHVRHFLIGIERTLHHVRRTAIEVRQDRVAAASLEAKPQETRLAGRATFHLQRLVLKRRQFWKRCTKGLGGRARIRRCRHHAGLRACRSMSNSSSLSISSTSSGMPSPVLQLVNRNGLLPRISRESCFITSRLAPTWGAKSVLLMTRMSECVIPGPLLRGILSPAATSVT